MPNYQAFLSYTRLDDNHFGRNISNLRKALELAVQVVTGDATFQIFQDIDGIELGDQWEKRIDRAIVGSRFFVPIITPLFFSSDACRSELTKFLEHEASLSRDDLVLPIYFMEAPALESLDQRRQDLLAQRVAERQYKDWRKIAGKPIKSNAVRTEIMELARSIAGAMDRTNPLSSSPRKQPSKGRAPVTPSSDIIEAEKYSPKSSSKVLWVDDRPENNRYERQAMAKYNVEFDIALNTGEALAKFTQNKFDAVISDMGRPPDPRAGYTLLAAIRELDRKVPFFIYAGSRDPEHIAEAQRNGAQGCTNIGTELITMVLESVRPLAYRVGLGGSTE